MSILPEGNQLLESALEKFETKELCFKLGCSLTALWRWRTGRRELPLCHYRTLFDLLAKETAAEKGHDYDAQ